MIITKRSNGETNYFILLIFLMVCLGQAGIIEKMLSAASDWSDSQGTESCEQKKEKHPTYAVAIPQEKIVYVPMAPKQSSSKGQVVKAIPAQVVQAKIVKAAPSPSKMGQVVQAKVIKADSPSMVSMGKVTMGKMTMGQPWQSGGAQMMQMGNQWADASEQQEQQEQQQQQQQQQYQQSGYNYEDDYEQDEQMQESSSNNQKQSFEEILDDEEIDYSFSPSDSMQSPSRSLANILHIGSNGRYKISSMMTSDVDTEWD